jgi:hypothetical protein
MISFFLFFFFLFPFFFFVPGFVFSVVVTNLQCWPYFAGTFSRLGDRVHILEDWQVDIRHYSAHLCHLSNARSWYVFTILFVKKGWRNLTTIQV